MEKDGPDCPTRTVKEEDLQMAVVTAENDVWSRKGGILPTLKKNIASVLNGENDDRLAELEILSQERQQELLTVGNDESEIERIGDEIIKRREEKEKIMIESAHK